MRIVYQSIPRDSNTARELRKVFFCGAAFLADRLVRYSTEDPSKIEELYKELAGFADFERHKDKQCKDIASSIEEAWKYASPDKD